MVGWGVTERCRATERCRTVYHRIPVKPRATYNDMSERVLWIFSNLKWWTKRAQHGYIVWYFLVLLKIADVTLLHNNTAFLKNSEFATSGCKIEFLDPDGLVWPFRCWAAEGFFFQRWHLPPAMEVRMIDHIWVIKFWMIWDQLLLKTFPTIGGDSIIRVVSFVIYAKGNLLLPFGWNAKTNSACRRCLWRWWGLVTGGCERVDGWLKSIRPLTFQLVKMNYSSAIFLKHQRKSSETIEKFGYESYILKISYGY